ncbi:hypothetical protein LTR59_018394, partial [Friedmanniomyces endolithicus]
QHGGRRHQEPEHQAQAIEPQAAVRFVQAAAAEGHASDHPEGGREADPRQHPTARRHGFPYQAGSRSRAGGGDEQPGSRAHPKHVPALLHRLPAADAEGPAEEGAGQGCCIRQEGQCGHHQ